MIDRPRRAVPAKRLLALLLPLLSLVPAMPAHAAAGPTDTFALQISPSPLVVTAKPGVKSTEDLSIRNNGTATEDLKMEIRHFTFDSKTGGIAIDDTAAADLSKWVTFSSPKFSVASGQTFTQDVTYAFPSDSGFSYSFVILITRQASPQATGGGRVLQGTVANFSLVNIDRPGATRALELSSIKASSGIYEYVPATLSLTFKNTGNTYVQPAGNIFIGRGDAKDPITTLDLNNTQSAILPGTTRTITAAWGDGFPRTESQTLDDGTVKTREVWNWGDLSKFRIGPYTAHAVAVYNNGTYDVPLNAQTTFWILPWKIILGALLILALIVFGIVAAVRSVIGGRGGNGGRGRSRGKVRF